MIKKNNERCLLNLLMKSKSDIEYESTRTLYGFNLKNYRSLTPSLKFGTLRWKFHAMETLVQQPGRLKHALVSPMWYSTTLNKPEKRRVGYESCPDFWKKNVILGNDFATKNILKIGVRDHLTKSFVQKYSMEIFWTITDLRTRALTKTTGPLPFLSESSSASVESGNLKKKTTILHFHDWLKEDSYELFLPLALSQEPSKLSSWFPNLLHLVDRNQSI